MRIALIVAAGGSGERFKAGIRSGRSPVYSGLSKLFYPLGDKPLLIHSLLAFSRIPEIREKFLVVPASSRAEVRKLLRKFDLQDIQLVAGGRSRAESVYNGLKKSGKQCDWIMVHDAARPFVSQPALKILFKAARSADGAILASRIVPTVKEEIKGTGEINRTLDRSVLFGAETPQLVKRELLLKAYKSLPGALEATDEASLLEGIRARVKLALHDGWNPKITAYHDLRLAEVFLNGGNNMQRTGLGKDLHRLAAGRKLYLGGLEIPHNMGSLGHSDGDVIIHAVIDAMLGALALGDIGEWFSDRSKKFKGIRSEKLLAPVVREIEARGWKAAHIDVTVTLERPKLGGYKEKIRRNLARLTGVSFKDISIKAKTNEGLGAEGEGKAVSCDALVTLVKGSHD